MDEPADKSEDDTAAGSDSDASVVILDAPARPAAAMMANALLGGREVSTEEPRTLIAQNFVGHPIPAACAQHRFEDQSQARTDRARSHPKRQRRRRGFQQPASLDEERAGQGCTRRIRL